METASVSGWEWANRIARILFLIFAIPVVWLAHYFGLIPSLLMLLLLIMLPRTLVTRGFLFWKKGLAFGWWRHALKKEGRIFTAQFALRAAFWILAAVAVTKAVVPIVFDRSEYVTVIGIFWGLSIMLALLDAFPSKVVRLTTLLAFGLGALGMLFQLVRYHIDPGDAVVLDRPVKGEWYAISGGRSSFFNHHYSRVEQRHAVDLVKADGRTFRGDPAKVESYFAWDQEILAPADGVVVTVVNNLEDEEIGDSNDSVPEGNSIVLRIEGGYILLAHLKKGSVRVAKGEAVKVGQVLATCGNSGSTAEPHLHIQVQSHADTWSAENRTFPIRFKGVGYLRRNDRPDFGN